MGEIIRFQESAKLWSTKEAQPYQQIFILQPKALGNPNTKNLEMRQHYA